MEQKKKIKLELSYDIDELIWYQKVLIENIKKETTNPQIINFQQDILTILNYFKSMNIRYIYEN